MRHTLPPLAFCALQAVRQVAAAEKAGDAPKVKGVGVQAGVRWGRKAGGRSRLGKGKQVAPPLPASP